MARKSRQRDTASSSYVVGNDKTFFNAAGYLRLSNDDTKKGGDSIKTQQSIIESFIAASTDIHLTGFYIDNNMSGTNFERPGFKDMIADIEQGRVDCVIVKDFSRFGRNAVETGFFIERVFPLRRVRFISVSDRFDSAEHEGGTGGMEVALKLLVHEYYSRDLSRKIKSSVHERMRRGEYITGVFGYQKDVSGVLAIEEDAAAAVRRIFALAIENKTLSEIRKCLYEEKRLTPSVYRKRKASASTDETLAYIWSVSSIQKILSDEQYTGIYVAGKTRKDIFASHKQTRVDKSEWIRIPNHHPAIIERAFFDDVQKIRNAKSEPLRKRELGTSERYPHRNSPMKGKVICGYCGHAMTLSNTKNAAFHCVFTRSASDAPCHGLYMLDEDLRGMVLTHIRAIHSTDSEVEAMPLKTLGYEQKINSYNAEKRVLYEKLVLGEIDKEAFKTAKAMCDTAIERLRLVNATYKEEVTRLPTQQTANTELRQLTELALRENDLTSELVEMIIDKVYMHPDKQVNIKWKPLFAKAADVQGMPKG